MRLFEGSWLHMLYLGRGQATPTNAAAVLALPSKTSDITLKISKTVMKPQLTCHMRQNPRAQHESHVLLPPRVSRSRERGRRQKRRVFGRDTGLLARSGCASSRVKPVISWDCCTALRARLHQTLNLPNTPSLIPYPNLWSPVTEAQILTPHQP